MSNDPTVLTVTLPASPFQPTSLSSLSVDYNSGKTQLQSLLVSSGSPWRALLPTETGDTLVSLIATVHAAAQQNIIRSFQDAFPDTAAGDSAIFAAAVMQGLRLDRKVPARLQVTITNKGSTQVVLPPYSTFSGANTFWFVSPEEGALVIDPGATATTLLRQGLVKSITGQGLGTLSQMFVSPEGDFIVADADTTVSITNTQGTYVLPRHTSGLWKANKASPAGSNPPTLGYVDRTTPGGALLVEFGDGTYGYSPRVSDTVTIQYVVTSGSAGNAVNALNKALTATGNPNLAVTAIANPISGADQTPALRYKNIASSAYGTFDSAVNQNQLQVVVSKYPGIVDAVAFPQRDVQTSDKRWMNLVQVTVLAATPFSPTQQLDPVTQAPAYIRHLEASTNYSSRFYLVEPTPNFVDLVANVFCKPWASLAQAETASQAAVSNLFAKATLNFDVMETDITSAILGSYTGIDFIDLIAPSGDLIVSTPQLPPPTIVISPTGGTLDASAQAGSLVYAVGYTTASTVVKPTNEAFSVAITGATNKADVSWSAISTAISYQLYGRGASGWGIIYSGPLLTFSDTGSVAIAPSTPATGLQKKDIRFNSLRSSIIRTFYSTRATSVL